VRALVVCPDGVEVAERPDPEPAHGEVVVAVSACGICGSDVHHIAGSPRLTGRVIGHEFSGTVVEVGDGVDHLRLGQHVAVNPLGSCGACDRCAQDLPFLCENVPNLGLAVPGGFAERVAVPEAQLYGLPDSIDIEIGSRAEPLAVALAGIDAARPSAGEDALVFGVGTIGLCVIAGLRAQGAGRIVAVGRSAGRRAAAAKLGADVVLDARATDIAEYAASEGIVFPNAFECSGAPGSIAAIAQTMAVDGTIVEIAIPSEPSPVEMRVFVNRNLRLAGSCAFGLHHYRQALDLLTAGAVDTGPIVSERVALDEAPLAFKRLLDPVDLVGVLVEPWR
jgi:threonine dehydrogenase-like Zn-dependent dehydrogenase